MSCTHITVHAHIEETRDNNEFIVSKKRSTVYSACSLFSTTDTGDEKKFTTSVEIKKSIKAVARIVLRKISYQKNNKHEVHYNLVFIHCIS